MYVEFARLGESSCVSYDFIDVRLRIFPEVNCHFSGFGARLETSIATSYGCAGTSSGAISSGV